MDGVTVEEDREKQRSREFKSSSVKYSSGVNVFSRECQLPVVAVLTGECVRSGPSSKVPTR
jgi:hypothetical protein